MAIVTRSPTTNAIDATDTQGGWVSPGSAYTVNAAYAQADANALSLAVTNWGGYGFDGILSAGATITKVELVVTGHLTVAAPLFAGRVGGTTLATHDPGWTSSDSTTAIDITADRAWTRADLLDATFTIQGQAGSGDGLSGQSVLLDALLVRVTYTAVYNQSFTATLRPTVANLAGAPNKWGGLLLALYFTQSEFFAQRGRIFTGTLQMGSSSAPDPSSISGLVRWYKADALVLNDGDPVTTWTDSSGNANATAAGAVRPTYKTVVLNGKPVVRFDGNNRMDFTAFATLNDFTMMAVVAVQHDSILVGADTFQAPTTWPAQLRIGEITDELTTYDGVSAASSVMPVPETQFSLVEFVRSGSTISWYQNGVSLGTGTMRAPSDFDQLGTALTNLGQFYTMLGDMAELVLYTHAVSATERQALEGYFTTKYLTTMLAKKTSRGLSAALSWIGNFTYPFRLAGALSFIGNLNKRFPQDVAGTLSFIGTFSKRTSKQFFGFVVSNNRAPYPKLQEVTVSTFPTAATTHAVAMPATVNSGDGLIIIYGAGSTISSTAPAAWNNPSSTELAETRSTGFLAVVTAHWRVADGTEGGTTVTLTNSNSSQAVAHVYRFSGTTATQNFLVVGARSDGASTTAPDPPSLTAINNENEIGMGIAVWEGSTTVTRFPAGNGPLPIAYTGQYSESQSGGTVAIATSWAPFGNSNNSALIDPGPFANTPAQNAGALTLRIRPAVLSGSSLAKQVQRAFAATLSFIGTFATLYIQGGIRVALTATLSFIGAQSIQTNHRLTAALSFVGNFIYPWRQTAALSFVGSLPKRTVRGLTGALSFVGAHTKQAGKALAGGLSFIGSGPQRFIGHTLAATLSFLGSLPRVTTHGLTGSLSFVGSTLKQTQRLLTAALSFIGVFSRTLLKIMALAGTLSFIGAQTKQTGRSFNATVSFIANFVYPARFSAALSFVGAQAKRTSRALTASLSFIGTMLRAFPKALTATLSFIGAHTKQTGKGLTATASFIGSVPRRTNRGLTAVLSFVGNFRWPVRLTAALSFLGSTVKQTNRALPGGLSFIGAFTKRTGKALSAAATFLANFIYPARFAAALSFLGTTTKRTARSLAATLGFIGVWQIGSHAFILALAASLAFSGTTSRQFGRSLAATVAFSAAIQRRTARAVAGRLSWVGQMWNWNALLRGRTRRFPVLRAKSSVTVVLHGTALATPQLRAKITASRAI